jgi:very-short-patch-repair endonuclease
MVRRGLLHRLHRGVYAFGALSPAPEQRWAAALLAAGDGSALSNTTAATAFGQLPVRSVIEVTAPTHRRGDEMLRVHWRQDVDTTWHRGLRVTTPAQTLLDLAAARWPIDRMTHDMAASGHVSLSDLKAFAHNRRGEPGARALRAALALPHTRSAWEREFAEWVSVLGVPAPRMNDRIGRLLVDAHWPDHDLVIELDTEQTHGTAWKRRDDADRDAWLESIGKEVWRVRTIDAALERRLRHRLRP